jgi:hypothetical protein
MITPIRVFISHSTKDLNIVLSIKEELSNYAIESFVAHEDINPSEVWVKRIVSELCSCDVFMPILTNSFRHSKWCEQETGYAISRNNMAIVPVNINHKPYGFIASYQAIILQDQPDEAFFARLIKALVKDERLHIRIKRAMIDRFSHSDNFEDTKQAFERLTAIGGFSRKELDKILHAACKNNQIYNYMGARRCMDILLDSTSQTGKPLKASLAAWKRT